MKTKLFYNVNAWRRHIMQNLTKNVVRDHQSRNDILPDAREIKRILVCRPNERLGNLLLVTPLVQEITAAFPNSTIDLFVKGNLPPVIFRNYAKVNRIVSLPKQHFSNLMQYLKVWISLRKVRYDMVINVDNNSSSGRLATRFAKSRFKFFGESCLQSQSDHTDYRHMAKRPVYSFRSYIKHIGSPNAEKVKPLDIRLSASEIAAGKDILNAVVGNMQRTICLFTHATGNKVYPEIWWLALYQNLKKEYPEFNIIEILPLENISRLDFRIPTFYSKDIRQIAALIANTRLFIGADSGMMHLASSAMTPTVGLFSVTNSVKYAPYGHDSQAVNTDTTNISECLDAIRKILGVVAYCFIDPDFQVISAISGL